ncbi:hypothetical protein [Marinicellulosiphila megalodicopiae]|uniref:hypothetical protein n=1 Tax=Marinicellulosiphila megalodicopiae TaxID=2724896 RepID=UPI003BAF347F
MSYFPRIFSVFLFFWVPNLSFAEDLINQILYPTHSNQLFSTISDSFISLENQSFKLTDYQYNHNYITYQQFMQSIAVKYQIKDQSHFFIPNGNGASLEDPSINVMMDFYHKGHAFRIGASEQAMELNFNDKWTLQALRSTHNQLLSIDYAGYDFNQKIKQKKLQFSTRYQIDTKQWIQVICANIKSLAHCAELQLDYQFKQQRFSLNYLKDEMQFNDEDAFDSDNFNIQYKLPIDHEKLSINYEFANFKAGISHQTFQIAPYLDVFYLNEVANSFGIGRKIIFVKGNNTLLNFFIHHHWIQNKHRFDAQIDINKINMNNYIYREYDSVLFLGLPVIKSSLRMNELNAILTRLSMGYEFNAKDYQLFVKAKQLLFYQEKNNQTNSDQTNTSDDDSNKGLNFLSLEGLNFTTGVKWKL